VYVAGQQVQIVAVINIVIELGPCRLLRDNFFALALVHV
jgi:hypothetical protein